MKKFFFNNGLSIALFGFFFIFLVGLSITGYKDENNELITHSQPTITYSQYLVSGSFGEAVFENWESEFLQMGALVILTIWLYQKGSADSKKLRGNEDVDTSSRYSIIHGTTWRTRGKAIGEMFYANSLSIALFALFFISFAAHAITGTTAYNEEQAWYGESAIGIWEFMSTSRFWFESFQNWQSEFLAVGVLILLSVFLRQRRSPESKAIGEPNSKTGSG